MYTDRFFRMSLTLVLSLVFATGAFAAPPQFAIEFNNANDDNMVLAQHSQSIAAIVDGITMEAWIFVTEAENTFNNHATVVGRQDSYQTQVSDELVYKGAVWGTGENGFWGWEGNAKVTLGAWHHVATSMDGKNMYTHVDGKLDINKPDGGPIKSVVMPYTVGHIVRWTAPFEGLIDEVRLSDKARYTDRDYPIQDKEFEADANTVILYHFNEGEGFQATDESIWGNHGVIRKARFVASDVPLKPLSVDPKRKLSTIWGSVKKDYVR